MYSRLLSNYIKIKIYRLKILCGGRTWSTILMGGIIQAEGILEYGAEEDAWAYQGRNMRRLEKTAK